MKPVTSLLLALGLFVSIYALGLFGMPRLVALTGLRQTCPWLAGTGLVPQLTFLIGSLVAAWFLSKGNLSTFGFKTTNLRHVLIPVLVCTVVMLILMSPMLLMEFFGPQMSGPKGAPAGPWPEDLPHKIILVWIIASTCEEVFYRGLLQSLLDPFRKYAVGPRRLRISLPVTLCALAFGLGHLCLLGRVPPPMLISILVSTTILGLIAGYYREKTGSLLPAIAAHMTFNIVGTIVPLLLQN